MKSVLIIILWIISPDLYNGQARRTAPRRTTSRGGTYGTETFATVPTTVAMATAAPVWGPAPAAPSVQFVAVSTGQAANAAPVVPGLASFAAIAATTRRTTKAGQTIPTRIMATLPPSEEEGKDVPGENSKQPHIPVVPLCEEVEEILKPGSTEQECFVAEPVTLRFWQPYRALRHMRCKNANVTAPSETNDQCPAVYPGASCVQKYQQFVILAALGPGASGWSCVRLASGCSCSVRAFKRLRSTDYEQRSDLREFMKS
ncbi:hypothetical protein BV898_10963 [Hypsibius exemplaris]|uniref:Spaetzle domain-containing protein n=1 Tax=Hypsibius exemplaris TaxID=2072580 RepID=A0A1W0WHY1_HYPEX|nr:hypothetical protein BV898_10963 [Hypsibius exemplaris]